MTKDNYLYQLQEADFMGKLVAIKVERKGKYQESYNQVPHLTLDTTWGKDKADLDKKYNKQESQEDSFFLAGDISQELSTELFFFSEK